MRWILISLSILLLFTLSACATETKTQPTPTVAVDEPYLYASEAIHIAKQHSVTSPVSASERHAAAHIRRLEALGDMMNS